MDLGLESSPSNLKLSCVKKKVKENIRDFFKRIFFVSKNPDMAHFFCLQNQNLCIIKLPRINMFIGKA